METDQIIDLVGKADGIVQLIGFAACALLYWLGRRDDRIADEVKQDIHAATTEMAKRFGAETMAALKDGRLDSDERRRLVAKAAALAREFTTAHGMDILKPFSGKHSRLMSYVEKALKSK